MESSLPVLFQFRCKICNLAKTHSELFKELHFNVLEVGMSMNRTMNSYNRRLELESLDAPKLNNQNMSVHFASHISLPDRVNLEIAKTSPSSQDLKDINTGTSSYVEDLVRRRVGNEVNDYLNLDQLRAQMMEKLDILDDIVARETEDGKKFVDLEAMSQYVTLIKEIRGTIMDLNKIRSSKQLMNLVIKSLIERSTFDMVQKLSAEYDQTKKDLLESGVDNSIVVRMDHNLRMRLAEIVATTARSAVEEITRQYKLS